MPLTSPIPEDRRYVLPGHLYVVATPIGNRDDITLRALGVLKEADLVAAEDTRHTAKLLSLHGIANQLVSCYEHNEKKRIPVLLEKLKSGHAVALVSNAGTPTVSDPGFHLIRSAVADNIPVVPIPGVSAPMAALCASGLPTDAFVFIGFLDRKKQKRARQIEELKTEQRTVILYESPRRILSLLEELVRAMANRYGVLCRELTKLHEEFIRGSLVDILGTLQQRSAVKGEFTLLIAGNEKEEPVPMTSLKEEIKKNLGTFNEKPSTLSKTLSEKTGISRNIIYDELIKMKKAKDDV